MTAYYFDFKINARIISDPLGTELANDAATHAHACEVAHELMRHRESYSRHWRLRVRRDGEEPCFHVPFAAVGHSLECWTNISAGRWKSSLGTSPICRTRLASFN